MYQRIVLRLEVRINFDDPQINASNPSVCLDYELKNDQSK